MSLAPDPETAQDRDERYRSGPPCPAERAEAADSCQSYDRARAAFLRAAEALAAAAKDAGVAMDSRCCPADTHIRLFIACATESADDLIDADKLSDLRKLGRC